jgi:hypothetical protein
MVVASRSTAVSVYNEHRLHTGLASIFFELSVDDVLRKNLDIASMLMSVLEFLHYQDKCVGDCGAYLHEMDLYPCGDVLSSILKPGRCDIPQSDGALKRQS